MDTRFWGPSGWCLLHLIAAAPAAQPAKIKEWFDLLEYVLPCKYCRASFHDYTKLQPLTLAIVKNRESFSRWLFDIHNRVNGKLRGQGLLTTPDPSWPSVRDRYFKMQAGLCSQPFIGWDFMTSVAYATPAADYKPVPMDDTPEGGAPTDLRDRNRYNLLTRQERIAKLKRWWALIPSILPCPAWRSAWASATVSCQKQPPLSAGKAAVMRWMWRVEEQVCTGLKCPTPHPSLPALRRDVAAFESPCGSVRKGRTCRTRKHKARRQVLTRRRRVQG